MTAQATLSVPTIHCEACVRTITTAVAELPGVMMVTGDAATRTIGVSYEQDRVGIDRIASAVESRGFEPAGLMTESTPAGAAHQHASNGWSGWLVGLLAICCVIPVVGYLAGFLGYAYGLAVPSSFGTAGVIVVAVASGIAAFFSPCVFPLLPGYMASQAGASATTTGPRLVLVALAAAAGLTFVNLAIAGVIALLGAATPFQPDPRQDIPAILAVRFVAGAVIVVLGVMALRGHALGPTVTALAGRLTGGRPSSGGIAGAFTHGATYDAAGIGCTGPILLALLIYAVSAGQGPLAFAIFGLTMGGLMFAFTLGATALGRLRAGDLAAGAARIQSIGAWILVGVGVWTMVSLTLAPLRDLFVRLFLPFLP